MRRGENHLWSSGKGHSTLTAETKGGEKIENRGTKSKRLDLVKTGKGDDKGGRSRDGREELLARNNAKTVHGK